MKIARIEISRHRIELDPPFRPSWDTRPRARFEAVVVRVESDDGHVGYGSGDDMLGLEQHLDLFLGKDPLALEQHYRYLANLQFHYGRCWPLDIALWDLAGQITGQPVWRMLGGLSNRVRAYASSGTLRDSAAMADTAQRFKSEGFPAMKIRFHRADWRDDIRAVAAVRRAVGDDFVLMVDCNQGWRMAWDVATPWSLKDALQVARALEDHGVYWMEEPLYRGDYDGMAQLRGATDLRIAGAEMTRELHAAQNLDRSRLSRCAAAGRGAGWRHHGAAPHRHYGAGSRAGVHAPYLGQRDRPHGEHPSSRRHRRLALPGISVRSAGMDATAPRLHVRRSDHRRCGWLDDAQRTARSRSHVG